MTYRLIRAEGRDVSPHEAVGGVDGAFPRLAQRLHQRLEAHAVPAASAAVAPHQVAALVATCGEAHLCEIEKLIIFFLVGNQNRSKLFGLLHVRGRAEASTQSCFGNFRFTTASTIMFVHMLLARQVKGNLKFHWF